MGRCSEKAPGGDPEDGRISLCLGTSRAGAMGSRTRAMGSRTCRQRTGQDGWDTAAAEGAHSSSLGRQLSSVAQQHSCSSLPLLKEYAF